MSSYKGLVTTIREMQVSQYSRFKDTSALPRDPIILGHKPSFRERYISTLKRVINKRNPTQKDYDLIAALHNKAKEEPEIDNAVASARSKKADSINNNIDLHTQRQIIRNRKAQHQRKIHEDVASVDRAMKVISKIIIDPHTGQLTTKKAIRSWPKRRTLVQRNKEEKG